MRAVGNDRKHDELCEWDPWGMRPHGNKELSNKQ